MTTTGTSTSRSYAGDSDMVKSSGNGTALLDASLANDAAEVNKFVIFLIFFIKLGMYKKVFTKIINFFRTGIQKHKIKMILEHCCANKNL